MKRSRQASFHWGRGWLAGGRGRRDGRGKWRQGRRTTDRRQRRRSAPGTAHDDRRRQTRRREGEPEGARGEGDAPSEKKIGGA